MENENEIGNSQIPEVEELAIVEGDDADVIAQKVADHNQVVADYKAKITESNKKLFARAKKAEGFELKDGKWVKPPKPEDKPEIKTDKVEISQTDLYALIKANVPQEDIDDVREYAALKKISIPEALKSNVIKTLLAEKAEERNTATATATNSSRRGNAQVSEDTLLDKASKGELPESDTDLDRLVEARLNKKGQK